MQVRSSKCRSEVASQRKNPSPNCDNLGSGGSPSSKFFNSLGRRGATTKSGFTQSLRGQAEFPYTNTKGDIDMLSIRYEVTNYENNLRKSYIEYEFDGGDVAQEIMKRLEGWMGRLSITLVEIFYNGNRVVGVAPDYQTVLDDPTLALYRAVNYLVKTEMLYTV